MRAQRNVARVQRFGKWFSVCWGVKEGGVGVKLDFASEERAWSTLRVIRDTLRKYPAELWGVEAERIGSTVFVVPRSFVATKREKKRAGVYDGLRKKVKGVRGY